MKERIGWTKVNERERERESIGIIKALQMIICFVAFQNGIPGLTNSQSIDVDFITTEGNLIQEYSCSISPGGERGCISRAVDLRMKTIPGMQLILHSGQAILPQL